MDEHDQGQVAASAAEVYEQFFLPALFIDWPPQVLDAAEVAPGHHLLDVACGTGVLARVAVERVGPAGSVVGMDINDGMLAVARTQSSAVQWQQGAAEAVPFESAEFDRVVSQFGLMFFQDRNQAIAEMLRVLKPHGKACVAVWAALEDTPGYLAVANMLQDLFGEQVAKSIEAPYCLGDAGQLQALFEQAGARQISVQTCSGKACFASLEAWLHTDIKGWTLAEVIDDAGYARLQEAAPDYLGQFTASDGSVEFEAPAHLVSFAS